MTRRTPRRGGEWYGSSNGPRETGKLAQRLKELLIGQPEAVDAIVPFLDAERSGLAAEDRPLGVLLLLGPTGTGKTRTVEALAELLHGSQSYLLKIDCGEFEQPYEIAKLIGAPPGYTGHRDTQPLLSQARLNAVASEMSGVSLVLFDEIEKAHPSMTHLLLGILDKGLLRTGDNQVVRFHRSLIFLTSNLGGREIQTMHRPRFGFQAPELEAPAAHSKAHAIGLAAVRRRFAPEFVNRIDTILTYRPLTRADSEAILRHIFDAFAALIDDRLGNGAFRIGWTPAAQEKLLDLGTSVESGARELKRMVERHFLQPVRALVADERIAPGVRAVLDCQDGQFEILLRS